MMKKTLCVLLAVMLITVSASVSVSASEGAKAFDFHNKIMQKYLADDLTNVHNYVKGASENSLPSALSLDFSEDGIEASEKYIVQISETADFSDCRTIVGIEETYYGLYNVKLGQHIFWRAGADENSIKDSPVHEVTVTSVGPRNCYVDGVTNVRDIGGYKSSLVENGIIRQGRYYRGANPNGITEKGKLRMTGELGIGAEIDLRDADQCLGPYVDGVEYYAFPIPSGTESIRFEQFAEEYYGIFTVISNADEAPVYLHCTAGADRTGISTFMLLTVCGADYDDIARDYLFTNFSTHGARYLENEFVKWWDKLGNFPGDTMADKAFKWLTGKGIEEEKIERIREIFVDGYISDLEREAKYDVTCDMTDGLENISFRSAADPSAFVGVKLDGRVLYDNEYSFDRETGIIRLTDPLEMGKEYTLTVVSEDGIGETTFSLAQDTETTAEEETTGEVQNRNDNENGNGIVTVVICVAAAIIVTAATAVIMIRKKTNRNNT